MNIVRGKQKFKGDYLYVYICKFTWAILDGGGSYFRRLKIRKKFNRNVYVYVWSPQPHSRITSSAVVLVPQPLRWIDHLRGPFTCRPKQLSFIFMHFLLVLKSHSLPKNSE